MEAGLHLTHKVHWSDLQDLFLRYKDPGIELPVGPCGRIHITKKKIQIQVENRSYLADKICTSPDCCTTETKLFRKNLKNYVSFRYNLFPYRYFENNSRDKDKILRFINSFTQTVHEFADTERKKIARVIDTNSNRTEFIDNIIKRLQDSNSSIKSVKNFRILACWNNVLCTLFPILIEAGETKTLLQFNDEEIRSIFHCQHGGQAVGNNWAFLYHYVMIVYFYTNLLVALRLEDKPEEWGQMKQNTFFRSQLEYDCDGQTFLDSCRGYLKDDVYMKDFRAMKELCKACFKFIYVTEMLAKEVGMSWINHHALWDESYFTL